MALIKKGKTWWLDIRVARRRIRRSLKTENWYEAKDKERQVRDQLFRSHGQGSVLIDDISRKYLDWAWTTKPASALREQQRLEKLKTYLSGAGVLTLAEITPLIVEGFRARLLEAGLSKATINRYLQLLRGLIYRAIDWGLFTGPNPLKKVKFYREQPSVQGLSSTQVQAVLEAARAISAKPHSAVQRAFADLVVLAINTGLRKSEILNLRWCDIQEEETLVKGKGDKLRRVPLNRPAREIIERQQHRGEFVFDIPNRSQHDLLRRTVIQLSKRVGFPFHFHLLRHYHATALIERGVDIVTVAELLGHSHITTSLIYAHTSKERKRKAVETLEI